MVVEVRVEERGIKVVLGLEWTRTRVREGVGRGEGKVERMVEEWRGDCGGSHGRGIGVGGDESCILFCQGVTKGSMGDEAILPANEIITNTIK